MNLESRVERLEYELNILKNEIQQTLFDIQEQVLTHYYPTLRAEEEQPAEGFRASQNRTATRPQTVDKRSNGKLGLDELEFLNLDTMLSGEEEPAPTQSRRNGGQKGARSGHERFGLRDPHGRDEGAAGYSPNLREISMNDIRHREPGSRPQPNSSPLASRKQFSVLAGWVEESVSVVGKERTNRALATYASSGYLPDETRNLIVRLIDLSEETDNIDEVNPGSTFEILTRLDQILADEG